MRAQFLKNSTNVLQNITYVIFLLLSLITSCDNRIITSSYSTLSVYLNDEIKENESVFKINIDEVDKNSSLTLTCYHYNLDDTLNESSFFTFECEGLKLPNSQNSISISLNEFPSIGTYLIKAKSSEKSIFDKTFVVEIISSVSSLVVDYAIKSDLSSFKSKNIKEEEKSGTLSEENNSVSLLSSAEYTFSVRTSTNELLNNIVIEENNALLTLSSNKDGSYSVFVNGNDKENGKIKFSSSYYNTSFYVNFTIRDIALLNIKEDSKKEDENDIPIINLSLNDATKDYDILLNSLTENHILEFSLNAEEIEQGKYYDGSSKNYTPLINKSATWFRANTSVYTYNDESFYKVSFNGTAKKLSITPLKNTTFMLGSNEENLHTYIYIKYDTDKTYRWKYRVIIGGKLEKISLSLKEGNTETHLDTKNEIIVDEDTLTGWIFKANFTPVNIENRECLWYIAKINSISSYTDENGIEFKAPSPLTSTSPSLKSINLDYQELYTLGNKTNGLKVYSYSLTGKSENEKDTIFVNYTPTNDDLTLVCMNIKTKLYTYVNIKNHLKNIVTVKGGKLYGNVDLSSKNFNNLYVSKNIMVKNENGTKSITTPYNGSQKTQQYPDTIDKTNPKIRTFYIHLNSSLTIEIDTSFSIETIVSSVDLEAMNMLTNPIVSTDALDNRKAYIKLQTTYNDALIDGKTLEGNSYITDEDGCIIKVKINGDIVLLLRVIIYK